MHNTLLDKLQRDKDGFLKNLDDWSKDVANALAAEEHIKLTAQHWIVIDLLREYYAEKFISLGSQRLLIKKLKTIPALSKYSINSFFLINLFPRPIRQAHKIAGLPKPVNCL